MFRGQYQHSVDTKTRMVIPMKFRDGLGERFIITKGLDKCLFVYAMEDWIEFEEKVKKLPMTDEGVRKFVRFFFGAAFEAERDNNGRTVIPQNLIEYAGITKEIVSIGVPKRIEIWSKENWDAYNSNDNFIDKEVAMKMAELGI